MPREHIGQEAEIFLGKRIEQLRLRKQVTRLQLGQRINKTERQIARYEAGELVPMAILEEIAEALDEPIQKKFIRRISFLRKLEIEKGIEQTELILLYTEVLPEE